MSKVCRLSLLSLLTLLFIAGCGNIQGNWILRENQPYLEKNDYKLTKVTFFCNGSFQGLVSQGDQTLKIKGMYDYNSCSGDLCLMSGDKVTCYRVRCKSDNQICLDMCGPEGFINTAVMVRWNKCPYRPACTPCDPCRPATACPSPCSPCSSPCPTCP